MGALKTTDTRHLLFVTRLGDVGDNALRPARSVFSAGGVGLRSACVGLDSESGDPELHLPRISC